MQKVNKGQEEEERNVGVFCEDVLDWCVDITIAQLTLLYYMYVSNVYP